MKFNLDSQENARNVVTGLTIGCLFFCFILLSISAIFVSKLEQTSKLTLTATPTVTPLPTASPTPEVITIEYVIKFISEDFVSTSVEYWYTSNAQGEHFTASTLLRNNVPHTITVQLEESISLEISAILSTENEGVLICQIYEDSYLIVQNTNSAQRPGVYCSGISKK